MTEPATARPPSLTQRRPRAARCHLIPLETPDQFARLGIALVAVADGIDTTDTTTRETVRALTAALLRAERTVRSERAPASLADARENGPKPGRPPGRPRLQIDRDQIPTLLARGSGATDPTRAAPRMLACPPPAVHSRPEP